MNWGLVLLGLGLALGWLEMAPDGHVVPVDPQAMVAVTTKKKNPQSSRSWVMLDSSGESTVLDVDKYAIMHRVHIHARDLRILDPLLFYPSTILGREKAIVLNLEVCLHLQFFSSLELVIFGGDFDYFCSCFMFGNSAH